MQKKIIASLLVSPLAFNAMANISLPNIDNSPEGNKWVASGVIGEFDIFKNAGRITCPVGGGVLSQKIKVNVPGTYRVAITNPENATVKAIIGDETFNAVTPEGANKPNNFVEFPVAGETEVTIEVSAINASTEYSFGGATIEIVFDFAAAKAELQRQLNEVVFNRPSQDFINYARSEEATPEAKTLVEQLSASYLTKKSIQGEIDALPGEDASYEDKLAAYEAYQNKTLEEKITNYANEAKTYNENVAAEEAKYNTYKANKAAYEGLMADVTAWEQSLTEVDGKINAEGVSEAVKAQCQSDITAISEAIASYKKAVIDAYADLYNEDIEKPESPDPAINDRISALDAKFDKAVADEAALAGLAGMSKGLDDAYLKAQITITGFAGVEGYENVFGANQADWMNQISAEKEKGAAALSDTDPANAAANKETVQNAIDAINAIVDAAQTLVDDQNEAMEAAQAALGQVETAFKAQTDAFEADSKGLTIDDEVQEAYDAKVEAISAAITAAKGTVDTEYGKNDLTADDYNSALTEIDALISDLNDFLVGQNLVNKAEAQKALNELVTHITTEQKDLGVDILGKFNGNGDGTIPSLQAAINALLGENTEVMTAIKTATANADKLIGAFKGAKTAYDEFKKAIDRLNEIVPGKTIISGSAYDKTAGIDKTVEEFNAQDAKWQTDYAKAGELPSQECYAAATALENDINTYGWKSKIDDAFNDFEKEATEANYQLAVDRLKTVKDNTDAELPDDAYTEIDETMGEISTALDAAVADVVDFSDEEEVNAKVDACAAVDADVEKVLASIKNISDNQTAYLGFVADLKNVQKELDKLVEFNENNALEPAQDFFANAINGENNDNSLQADLNALNDKLDKALAALSVVDDNETIKAEIEGLLTKISNMEANIIANEDAHNAQLTKSQDARKVITDNLASIQKDTDPALAEEWVDQLESLRDNDLLNTDRSVTKAYAEGKCASENYVSKYDEIIEKANSILAAFEGGYAAKVATHNSDIVSAAGWAGKVDKLRATYLNAISAYNAYRGIQNPGYKAYLTENNVFESHAGIYDYSTKTRELESAVTTAVTGANTANKALTADEFKEMATDKADAMIGEMEQMVAAMTQSFNEAGEAYYNILEGEAEGAIGEAKTKLAAAGLADQTADILKNAEDKLKDGQDAYNKAMDPEGANGQNIGLEMDGIATTLDQVMPIDLQTGALNKWNSEYADAVETFNNLGTELNGYTFASPEVKATQTALYNKAVADAIALDVVARGNGTLIDELADYLSDLDGYIKAAQDAVKAVQISNDGNKANQEAYDKYTGTDIPDLNSKLDALKTFVNALGGTSKVEVDAVETAVNAVVTEVESNKAQLTDKETEINNLIAKAETAINNAYKAAFGDEITYLTDNLLQQAKVSFNNAKAADTTGANKARLDEINKSLDAIITAVGKLPLAPSETDTPEKFQEAARDFEKQICDYIAELQQMYTPYDGETTVDGVLGELGQTVGEVQQSIDTAKTTLSGYEQEVQDKFGPQIEALQSELDNIKTEFEAAGSTVIAQQKNYEKRISEISEKLDELEQAAAAEQVVAKQHAESNARYEVLKGEYDDLVARFDAFKQMLQEYGIDGEKEIFDIQYYLTLSIDDLEAQKEAFTLNASSKLKGGERAAYLLDLYTLKVKKTHAENLQTIADSELMSVGDALAGYIVPDVKAEITSELVELRNQYNTLNIDIRNFIPSDNVNKPGAADIDEYIQKSEEIAATAKSLVEKAEAGRFYPGDLNGSADGEVNVADIQILLNWIGEGMTYEALAAENPVLACAADMTGDKVLNVADVTILIQKVLNPDAGTGTYAMVRGIMPSDSSIDAVLVGEDNGTRTYAINLANNETFIAGQFDLTVEGGAEIVSVTAADRLGSHELYTYDNADNTRVIIASMENSQISGNEGTTIFVEVKGRSGVGISNAIFADENSQAYSLGDKTPGTSGIDSIYNSAKAMKDAIYDAAGRALKSVQRGINIIRHSDGTVTKELRK